MSIFAIVRRIFIFSIVGTMLLVQPGFREFLKIPALFLHYAEHLSSETDLSFVEFIHDHYCPHHHHCDTQGGHDHDLPFQSGDTGQINFAGIIPTQEEWLVWPELNTAKGTAILHISFFTEPGRDIWQPPKI